MTVLVKLCLLLYSRGYAILTKATSDGSDTER